MQLFASDIDNKMAFFGFKGRKNPALFGLSAFLGEPNGPLMCIFGINFKPIASNYLSDFPALAEPNQFLRGCNPGERKDFSFYKYIIHSKINETAKDQ
jgi:hypothetical protein